MYRTPWGYSGRMDTLYGNYPKASSPEMQVKEMDTLYDEDHKVSSFLNTP